MQDGILPLIPARGGSKGIPKKNLVKVGGVSLLERAIDTCRRSTLGDPMVSTDCSEIMDVCRRLGVDVIHRPSHLARDDTPMVDVVCHAIDQWVGTEAVCVLQPTNPLRTHHLINEALMVWNRDRPDSLACRVKMSDMHPGKMTWADGSYLFPDMAELNRQLLPDVFHRDGSCYIISRDTALAGTMYGERHSWLTVPRDMAWDVDNYLDIAVCEALLSREGR